MNKAHRSKTNPWFSRQMQLTITINSILNAYGKVCDVEKCEELFNKYCSKEHEIEFYLKPTVITFSHIITCIANAIDKIDGKDDEK